jgi:hypothetical protein
MSALPKSLGRYQVLGQLATGGMAEILLGRVLGPSGFERPVVLKRVLPHLVKQQGFVEMFLDEARIVAGIRHPAVVNVHELCHAEDELFLVMEFLEGETVAGLQKRLLLGNETLDRGLAAYIVAEACAGLHAAHELTDRDGAKQELVHRDVSPQNLFVTYDGHVKVLDFGIAKVVDRVTRTETGQVKGKFEYMSPEQCKNLPLDRRSDVFATGIVLYELTLARRLFRRPSPAETIMAISSEPIVPPLRVDADYPPELERICLRALAADPRERYETALAMRKDLLAVAGRDSTEALAEVMRHLFADRIAEKRELLRRAIAGSEVEAVPAGEVDDGVEVPGVPPDAMGGTGVGAALSSEIVRSTRRGGRRPRLPMGTGVVVGALAVVGLVAWRAGYRGPAQEAGTLPTSMPSQSSPSLPTDVAVHIDTVPVGADVTVPGHERGVAPVDIRLPRAEMPLSIEIARPGYATLVQSVVPDRDQKLVLVLEPLPSALSAPSAPLSHAKPKPRPVATGHPPASPDSTWEKWH